MIKDKLHTLTDEEAIEVALILLKGPGRSDIYLYKDERVTRVKYDFQDGCDAEESINIFFKATAEKEVHKNLGWVDQEVMVQLIERDSYHDYPYFVGHYKRTEAFNNWPVDTVWKGDFLANQIEAIEWLQKYKFL